MDNTREVFKQVKNPKEVDGVGFISGGYNQCDGCRRELPLINGIHRGDDRHDMIGCTKTLYIFKAP